MVTLQAESFMGRDPFSLKILPGKKEKSKLAKILFAKSIVSINILRKAYRQNLFYNRNSRYFAIFRPRKTFWPYSA